MKGRVMLYLVGLMAVIALVTVVVNTLDGQYDS